MSDLLAGVAIAMVLEGLLWALAPDMGRRMVRHVTELPQGELTRLAWGLTAAGVFLFWLVRGA